MEFVVGMAEFVVSMAIGLAVVLILLFTIVVSMALVIASLFTFDRRHAVRPVRSGHGYRAPLQHPGNRELPPQRNRGMGRKNAARRTLTESDIGGVMVVR